VGERVPSLAHFELHLQRLWLLLGEDAALSEETAAKAADLERALSRLEADSGAPSPLPLLRLAERFGLDELSCEVLILAAAPALSAPWRDLVEARTRYGKLDVAFAVAFLARRGVEALAALAYFAADGPLRRHGLLEVTAMGRGDHGHLLSYRLQAPLRVLHFLLEQRVLEEPLSQVAQWVEPRAPLSELVFGDDSAQMMARRLRAWCAARGSRVAPGAAFSCHVRGPSGVGKSQLVRSLGYELGMPLIEVDCALVQGLDGVTAAQVVTEAFATGRLFDGIVVFDRIDLLLPGGSALAALRLAMDGVQVPLFLLGSAEMAESSGLTWRSLTALQLKMPESEEREKIWCKVLQALPLAEDVEVGLLANQYPLTGAQIVNAVQDAMLRREGDAGLSLQALGNASSEQLRADLSAFARPRATRLTLEDLVLPRAEIEAIKEIITACRQRAAVMHRWGFRRRLNYGTGIVVLFAGEPGTGKTLCAQIIAECVGMSLYQIAIPSIVSKWIGETERNISQIFHRATASQAILLFDEADSLLATRTEVRDATDRYANMSTNQLLQEIEAFDGIVIMTTNREQNLDPAAERRILFRVNFPYPGVDQRRELWRRLVPKEALAGRDGEALDFDLLAEAYELSGGHIKNAIMRGAYAAMDEGGRISTEILSEAAERECRAIGKLVRQGW